MVAGASFLIVDVEGQLHARPDGRVFGTDYLNLRAETGKHAQYAESTKQPGFALSRSKARAPTGAQIFGPKA